MESQYKSLYPATIDQLITGMSKSKNYAYLVVADPVPADDAEAMLYACREMNGQAESLKSISITEGFTQGTSVSNTISDSVSHSVSESLQKRDFSKLGKAAMAVTGLGLASSVMPAAANVLSGVATTAAELAPAALSAMGLGVIGNAVSSLMPSKTYGTSDGESHSKSRTVGESESRQQSASRNIVNKHIEAVGEHLFYHSKRIESGKAIGMWKVGVYLMANKKSDIDGGSLQLRSILSGQESIYEPVRMHDVSQIVDGEIKDSSIAKFASPLLMVKGYNGKPFNHPLGEHYGELRTVLTTKELSYLINFPLHSVPGISVVNSCPDFVTIQQ